MHHEIPIAPEHKSYKPCGTTATVSWQESKGLGVTQPISATEHFVAQTSDITTASHAWLKPHNCCVFPVPIHSFTSGAPYGKGISGGL